MQRQPDLDPVIWHLRPSDVAGQAYRCLAIPGLDDARDMGAVRDGCAVEGFEPMVGHGDDEAEAAERVECSRQRGVGC